LLVHLVLELHQFTQVNFLKVFSFFRIHLRGSVLVCFHLNNLRLLSFTVWHVTQVQHTAIDCIELLRLQVLVLDEVVPIDSLFRVNLQQLVHERCALQREFNGLGNMVGAIFKLVYQFINRLSHEGWVASQHLVKKAAKRPDVRFVTVLLSKDDLGSHIQRRTDLG